MFSKHQSEFSVRRFVSEAFEEERLENNSLSDQVNLMP
jgi:hypothetical protein